MKKNRQNPLRKRYLRELRGDFGKYLVIFILLVFTIGLISGFLVADGSMIIAYNESFEKYRIEDGNFQTDDEISRANRRKIEKSGVILYDNFYIEKKLKDGNTLRIFKNREEINLLCLMEGRFPEKRGDLVIDRMYADNNGIHVGDELHGKSILSYRAWLFRITVRFFRTTATRCSMQSNSGSAQWEGRTLTASPRMS